MPREVNGSDGISWSCVEAYAGLSDEADGEAAERAASNDGKVAVVCTPGDGAKSVRLELPADWQESVDDARLLAEIEAHRET
jgi:hypothetical protein